MDQIWPDIFTYQRQRPVDRDADENEKVLLIFAFKARENLTRTLVDDTKKVVENRDVVTGN